MADQTKTFILGLGNQKCGTTWLHRYLKQSAAFKGGFAKEYHIWDALDLDIMGRYQVKKTSEQPLNKRRERRYQMQTQEDAYFDYFASLLQGTVHITGDITPSYCGLSTARLITIKEQFYRRGIAVKPVIFIRDPLARIKSAVRYNLDKQNYTEGVPKGETDFNDALQQYFLTKHCMIRTQYQNSIPQAVKAFGVDNLYVGLFENMFSASQIDQLSQFLGVAPNHEFGSVSVNKTKSNITQTDLDVKIRAHYVDTYAYCRDHFPETRRLWQA